MSEHSWLKTRLGWLLIHGSELGVTRVAFAEKAPPSPRAAGPYTRAAAEALTRYFAGELTAIDAVAIAPLGTPFQRAVWAQLRRVPAGKSITYAELAEGIGRPRAQRAVGQANAKNPLAILVPCHRVISSGGALGGYAWGAQRKAFLLEHEHASPEKPKTVRPKRAAPNRAPPPLPLFDALPDAPLFAPR